MSYIYIFVTPFTGNRSLTRILPQIYTEKPDVINAYVSHLLAILPLCDDADQTYLIQLTSLVAKHSPKVKTYIPWVGEEGRGQGLETINAYVSHLLAIYVKMLIRPI